MKTIVMCPLRPHQSHLTLSASPRWWDTSTPGAAYPARGKIDVPKPATSDTFTRGGEARRAAIRDLALADAYL
jgi:hypothetical protein